MDIEHVRHVFVAGRGNGLGLSLALAFAEKGLCVTLADTGEATLQDSHSDWPKTMRSVILDLRNREQWSSARQSAEDMFGPVDLLLNCTTPEAGGADLATMDPVQWDQSIAIGLTGIFDGIREFAVPMQQRQHGCIVNAVSATGYSPDHGGPAVHAVVAAGTVALGECLGAELAPAGIGVAALFAPDSPADADVLADAVLQGIKDGQAYLFPAANGVSQLRVRTKILEAAHQISVPDAPLAPVLDGHFRHALVTGGASGIGLGIADALRAQGVAVTIVDINDNALSEVAETRQRLLTLHLDVRDRDRWSSIKREAEDRFGPVDILVNNAGVTTDGRQIAEMDGTTWDRVIDIDLTGVFNGVQAFGADMRARWHGHIVNTASLVGLATAMPRMASYAAAKHAVVALSEALRLEMEPYGVGVTCLCPGFVETNLHANTMKVNTPPDGRVFAKPDRTTNQPGLPISLVGACVVEAIAANRPFALTHPSYWPAILTRQQRLLSAAQGSA